MKVVILAGGFGTRLGEETGLKPKPMVEIGERPILWHIMKIYSHFGFNDFIICLGYKGFVIKEYFMNYLAHNSDIRVDTSKNEVEILNNHGENWNVYLIDTGLTSMTGGRILRIKDYIKEQTFMLTYGDGVANINVLKLLDFHKKSKKLATVTAVKPEGRFGFIRFGDDNEVTSFEEKPAGDGGWANGGFFVLEPGIFDYIKGDDTIWEKEPLEKLAADHELNAFKFDGFWKSMDTPRDKQELDALWKKGNPPWKVW
jgi:glucose-1-phosphate cytidylyltransferase